MEMKLDLKRFRSDERIAMLLRNLYESYGYSPYRMSKFEEYELYARNIDFLGGSGILTFTDTSGKLMALKPDVTLSIVKNSKGNSGTEKVYYKENVYRIPHRGGSYKEILQSGIECIGNIGKYELAEVLILALKSLKATGRPFRLDISHMGILRSLIADSGISGNFSDELMTCIKRKNSDGIRELARQSGVDNAAAVSLARAITLCGTAKEVLSSLSEICKGDGLEAVKQLEYLYSILSSFGFSDNIGIDLSVVNDMNYYRSLVFRGYIDCVPEGVLFGGRYDDLVKEMGRDCGAVGFAVALDKLQDLSRNENLFAKDVILVYQSDCTICDIMHACDELRGQGLSVIALPDLDNKYTASRVIYMSNDGTIVPEEKR